jgi:hypothetical protein
VVSPTSERVTGTIVVVDEGQGGRRGIGRAAIGRDRGAAAEERDPKATGLPILLTDLSVVRRWPRGILVSPCLTPRSPAA